MHEKSRRGLRADRRAFMGTCLAAGTGAVIPGAGAASAAPDDGWPARRDAVRKAWLDLMGPFPEEIPDLALEMRRVDDIEGMACYYLTYGSEGDDRVPAYLLVPEPARPGPAPAVICPHPTSSGSGKAQCVGLAGRAPGDPPRPPQESRAYGLELARWGYVTLSPDLFGDGERIPEGATHYDSEAFYRRRPEWSMFAKNAWDCMRAVDVLRTLDFVDPARIACAGHSLGGHTALCAAAFDDRIAACICNGGKLGWERHTDHWARPQDPARKRGPVSDYVYLPRFRPYIDDPALPIPCDFDGLMMLVAPRPLMVMSSEGEFAEQDLAAKTLRAAQVYGTLGAGDRIGMLSYPGEHNYPPTAKRFSFAWLDRWFGHTPAVPTLWPGQAV